MLKVILFSPNGYIGSHIKERLDGEKAISLLEITRDSNIDLIEGNYDVLVYSASITSVRHADAETYIKDNALCAVTMMRFCKKHSVKRIIYISSDEIYGQLCTDQVTEQAVMHSPNIYAVTKYLAEQVIMESGIHYYILRLPGVVGKRWGNCFLYRLIDTISRNEKISVYNADKDFNNVVDLDDLADFIVTLIHRKDDTGEEVFLLGNVERISLIEMINYIKQIYGSDSEIDNLEGKVHRYFTLNTDKAVSYGYRSKSIKKIIDELYEVQAR